MSAWRKVYKFNLGLSYWLSLAALMLILLFISFGRIATPFLADYQADIEDYLSQQLEQPVRFGRIEGDWLGFSPVLRALDVSIGEPGQSVAVSELYLQADIPASLWARQWRLAAIGVQGLQLKLEQDVQGGWQLLGKTLGQKAELESVATTSLNVDELFQVAQRVGVLRFADAQLLVQPYAADVTVMASADLMLRSQANVQQVQARLTLPDQQQLEVSIRSYDGETDWRKASVEVYADLPDSDWIQWIPQAWLPVPVQQLSLHGRFWLQMQQGVVSQAVLELESGLLQADIREQPTTVRLGAVKGFFSGDALQRKLWFAQLPISFSQDGPWYDWPLQLQQHLDSPVNKEYFELRAQQLDIEPLIQQVLQHLHIPKVREVVETLAAQGQLENTWVRWQPQALWPDRLRFDTNVREIRFSPWDSVPGATGVSGRILGNLEQGELHLDSDGFSLYLADLFDTPWSYQQANARLTWAFDEGGFWLTSPYLRVRGDEGEIGGDFVIRLFNDSVNESYMDLRVGIREGDASYTERYLPRMLQEQQPELNQWLLQAIREGDIHAGYFQYQGSLNSGAPEHARSVTLFFDVDQARFDYQPGWPELSQGSGQVYVHDWGVQVELQQGQVLNSRIGQAEAEVVYTAQDGATVLDLRAQLTSNVADGLYLIQQTPIASQATELQGWLGSGQVPAAFHLQLPFSGQAMRLQLDMQLQDASLSMPSLDVNLEQLRGPVHFDLARGVSTPAVSGVFLGQPFQADISTDTTNSEQRIRIHAKGAMQVEPLQQWLGVQSLPWQGSFDYQTFITLEGADSQLVVESDLAGVELALPAPLGKLAEQKVPSILQMSLAGRERHFRLRHANRFNFFAAQDTQTSQLRGEFSLGQQPARLPMAPGIVVRGTVPELPLLDWLQLVQSLPGNSAASSDELFVLQEIELQAGRLTGLPLRVDAAQISYALDADRQGWRAAIDSPQAAGTLRQAGAEQPTQVDLTRLQLPALGGQATAAGRDYLPSSVPALAVHIDQLLIGDEDWGSWQLKTEPLAQGVRFSDVQLAVRGAQVEGGLDWLYQARQHSSRLRGRLSGDNVARVLQNWGYSPSLSSEDFRVDLDVNWPAAPQDIQLGDLSGNMQVRFRNGQLNTRDTASKALRIFGLLNFDTIGRRLRLDFSDLLGRGLAYDSFKGDFLIEQGVFRTQEPFVLKGVSSELSFEGELDASKGQIQASLLVAMPFASNLPLAAVLAGSPAVGGALFLMERLAGDRIDRMAAVRYQISGDWEEPTISLLDN